MRRFVRVVFRFLILGSLLGALALSADAGPRTSGSSGVHESATELLPAYPRERLLSTNEAHLYCIEAEAGQIVRVVLDPRRLDLTASLLEQGISPVVSVSNIFEGLGPLWLSVRARSRGQLSLSIRRKGASSRSGRYRVALEPLRAGELWTSGV